MNAMTQLRDLLEALRPQIPDSLLAGRGWDRLLLRVGDFPAAVAANLCIFQLIPTVVDRKLWRRRLSSCLRSFLSPRPPSRGPVRPCGGPGRSRLFSLAAPAGNAVAGPRLGGRGDS